MHPSTARSPLRLRRPPAPGRRPIPHRPLAVIRLRGSQADMGAQHGAALKQLGGYRELLEFYTELPERILLQADRATRPRWIVRHLASALKDVLLRRLERRRPAAYLERTRAFMEALDMPADHARFIAVMDVMQNVVGLIARLGVGPFSRFASERAVPACSTLMVWGADSADGALRHARNFDFPGIGIWDRGPTVVFCDPDEGIRYGFATSRGADTPGVSAFNEAGISVTMHTRFHRDVTFDGASVVDLGHDIARRAETIADAVAIARERPVASTWGVAVSSARERRAVVIETNSRTVAVVEPDGEPSLTCANRYRHAATRGGQVASSSAWEAHSSGRQGRLGALIAAARERGGMTLDDLERALDDHVDPAAPDVYRGAGAVPSQPCTVKSMVLSPEERRLHLSVAPAPTARGPYAAIDWDWDGDVGGREIGAAAEPEPRDLRERAFLRYTEAVRLDRQDNRWRQALAELEAAVALTPEDPSYRFAAGLLRLKAGDFAAAFDHLEAGLALESVPLRRGQMLLWGSRAADSAGDRPRAAAMRRELRSMDHDELGEHRALARAEERRAWDRRRNKVQLNLLMLDAW